MLFKINRIRSVKNIGEHFTRSFEEESYQDFSNASDVKYINIKLKVDKSQGYRVYDEFSEDKIYKDIDGSFIVSTAYPVGSWIYSSYSFYAEVLEPQYLRDEIEKILRKTLDKYL